MFYNELILALSYSMSEKSIPISIINFITVGVSLFDQFAVATLRMIFRDYLPKEMDFCLLPPLLDLPLL